MKLLHTADWHLGRTTYNRSRRPDHEAVLAEIVALALAERPDLVVHAGDLFDSVRPAYSDISLALEVLEELAAIAPVVVVCGNHDSPALFRIFARLLGPEPRIRFVDRARRPEDGGILDFPTPSGRLRLAPLPFVHRNRVVGAFEESATWTSVYADRIHAIQEVLFAGLLDGYDADRDVLLLAAHLHVAGARFSGSERQIHVSETYATRLEHVPAVSYAAFGHIHRPQELPGSTPGRFAGSPLELDFGEEGEEKSVTVVEVEPGRPARIEVHPLHRSRRLRSLRGTLEQIGRRAASVGDALCVVTVETEEPIADLSVELRRLLPEATLLQVRETCSMRLPTLAAAPDGDPAAEPGLVEIFHDYLAAVGTRTARADDVARAFATLLEGVENEEEVRFDEEAALADRPAEERAAAGEDVGDSPGPEPRGGRPANGDDGAAAAVSSTSEESDP